METSKNVSFHKQATRNDVEGRGLSLGHDPNQPPLQPSIYVPVQYKQEGLDLDPAMFYNSLVDQAGYPSEILCRMTDGLFFYLNHNCPQSKGTQLIEPEKIFWENVALGHDADVSELVANQVSSLYDSAGIPYSLNKSGAPVLDRLGYLRFRVFEIRANPEECHQYWNKILKVFKLRDPATNLPFPTPIPRFAFPAYSDYGRRNIFINWQSKAVADLMQKRAKAETTSKPIQSIKKKKSSKLSRLTGLHRKDDEKEEPEAIRKAASEKKKAAALSVGASVLTTLMNHAFGS